MMICHLSSLPTWASTLIKHRPDDFLNLLTSFNQKWCRNQLTHGTINKLDFILTHMCITDQLHITLLHALDHFIQFVFMSLFKSQEFTLQLASVSSAFPSPNQLCSPDENEVSGMHFSPLCLLCSRTSILSSPVPFVSNRQSRGVLSVCVGDRPWWSSRLSITFPSNITAAKTNYYDTTPDTRDIFSTFTLKYCKFPTYSCRIIFCHIDCCASHAIFSPQPDEPADPPVNPLSTWHHRACS